jgi:TPR repeat protein
MMHAFRRSWVVLFLLCLVSHRAFAAPEPVSVPALLPPKIDFSAICVPQPQAAEQAAVRRKAKRELLGGEPALVEQARALLERMSRKGDGAAAFLLGVFAETRKEYEQAASWYRVGISAKHPKSALALAALYRKGMVTPPTADSATHYHTLAENMLLARIARGECGTMFDMGMIYLRGQVVPEDAAAAEAWLGAAAKSNDPRAFLELSALYEQQKEISLALANLEQAALLRHPRAMRLLALRHFSGERVRKDAPFAVSLLEQAARLGDRKSAEILAAWYRGAWGGMVDDAKNLFWLEQAATFTDASPRNMFQLAEAYARGVNPKKGEKEALVLYRNAAKNGVREAFTRLGEAALYGRGTERDPEEALRLFEEGAKRGDGEAFQRLSAVYRCGMGTEPSEEQARAWEQKALAQEVPSALVGAAGLLAAQDSSDADDEAVRLLLRAREQGDPRAAALLALAHLNGRGVEESEALFRKRLKNALASSATRGEVLLTLARAWRKGEFVSVSPRQAVRYLEEAVRHGHGAAFYELGRRLLTGQDGFPKDAERGEALLEQGAQHGNIASSYLLGKMRLKQGGNPARQAEGARFLERAARAGHVGAATRLARACYEGEGTPVSRACSEYWMERAAQAYPCSASELTAIARNYADGAGVKQDAAQASMFYERAAALGSVIAMRELGLFYTGGKGGVTRNAEQGASWFLKAAKRGDARAMLELANGYAAGDGVPLSPKRALEWWKKSAAQGNQEAEKRVRQAQSSGYGTTQ